MESLLRSLTACEPMAAPANPKVLYVFLDVQRTLIDCQARTHGGAERDALQVYTLGGSRLGLLQIRDQRFKVFLDGVGFKGNLADAAVNDAALVSAVANLTGLGIGHCGGHV